MYLIRCLLAIIILAIYVTVLIAAMAVTPIALAILIMIRTGGAIWNCSCIGTRSAA